MYVDARFDRKKDLIEVIERVDGKRVFKEYKPDWHFYVDDKYGSHLNIYKKPVKKIQPRSYGEMKRLLGNINVNAYESDVNPVFRMLEQSYLNCQVPKLNIAFFDIETDFDEKRGYSQPSEAANAITSVAVHLEWLDEVVCLAIAPKTLTYEQATEIGDEVGNTIICETEAEMLNTFIDLVEDADVLSGWNSDYYDVPYLINRIVRVLGKHECRRLSPWGLPPKEKKIVRGGKEDQSYEIPGKLSMDYMELYKKYNFEERHSYALNAIAEAELGEKKVEYDGTLDDLYKNDFKKFLQYNIQDTMLLDRLDKKRGYIDLGNTYAHTNCVLIPTVMGTVALIDQAATIEAHSRGMVVPDRKAQEGDVRAAGGWVAKPKKGFHKWIGSADLTSLYPSVIRALNMSPETIVGQVDLSQTRQTIKDYLAEAKKHTFAGWWNDRFFPLELEPYFNNIADEKLTLNMETGEKIVMTVSELRELIEEGGMPWLISANGTIFHYEHQGVIPSLLTRWFKERKDLQGIMKLYKKLVYTDKDDGLFSPDGFSYEPVKVMDGAKMDPFLQDQAFSLDKFMKYLEDGNDEANEYLAKCNVGEKKGKLIYLGSDDELEDIIDFWDKRQMIRKLALNSTYGCLLNAGSKFFDQRLGQSTTLTGRNITRHMAAKTNESFTGVYDHYGEACVYGDTDSTYYSAYPILKSAIEAGEVEWTKDSVIQLYNQVSSDVSDTFPEFLEKNFNVPIEMSKGIIKSDREIVADTALFIKKKRYAARVYDDEGNRKDIDGSKGKMKIMGLDLRRSDTPVIVQDFLKTILEATLDDQGEDHVIDMIREFKEHFSSLSPWEMGAPKAVNNLTSYREKMEIAVSDKLSGKSVSLTIPGHVRASLNWNTLRDIHGDWNISPIIDGQKVIVCKLNDNSYGFTSVAYPVDESRLPDWFMKLPFDVESMTKSIVDKKVENLLGVLKWKLHRTSKESIEFEKFFTF